MHDLKPFRILISLLDKPELGKATKYLQDIADIVLGFFIFAQIVPRVNFSSVSVFIRLGPAILEDVLIEVFRTLHTQCRAELDLQNQNPFSKDQTQLSRYEIHYIYSFR